MDTAEPGSRANLPHILTQFIGRQQEMADIRRLLADRRLLTLTGPGGSGKTRLALEVAAGLNAAFPGGIWLVELAELTEPALVPQAVAAVLEVREAPGQSPLATVSHFLNSRRALLLLDNCEHLLDACAHLAAALLQSCPDLRLLVTSRQALGLPGEIVRPMLPLALPAPHTPLDLAALAQVEAIALFLDRATALAPDFSLTASNAASIIQICRLLDGMPLAIELAAARVPILSVAQIADRLDDSLRLLAAGPRLGLPRHQTMRAAIDWSYTLLTEPEQMLWRRLSVFRGIFSLAAVELVCSPPSTIRPHKLTTDHGSLTTDHRSLTTDHRSLTTDHRSLTTDILDLLTQLVHKSLVLVTRGEGEARYQLLEPLRQYAAEQLAAVGETALIQQRHCDYFLAWAEAHEANLRGAGQLRWLRRFESEYANLRAALTWALHEPQGGEAGLRLAGALGIYWILHDLFSEGRRWLEAALARPGAERATIRRGQALFFACVMAWYQGDVPAARRWIEESHALMLAFAYEGQWGIAYTLMMFGQVVRLQGEEEAALRYLGESVARFRQTGDRWGLALTLDCLGSVSLQVGNPAAARAALEESQALWRTLGDPWGMGLNSLIFVELAEFAGDEAVARAIYEANKTAFETLGHSWYLSGMQLILAGMALRREDYAAAVEQYNQCLAHARRIGRAVREAAALTGLGAVALAQGRGVEAVAHCQAGLALLEQPPRPDTAALCLETVAGVADRTGYPPVAARLRATAVALRHATGPSRKAPVELAALFAEALAALQPLILTPQPPSKPVSLAATASPFDLTIRELEVLRLAAEGLTDPQIAERLVISRRTVNAHLRSIYSKLNVPSRTAAARLALERNLL